MAVIRDAWNGADAVDCTRILRPDVVVLDLVMPSTDGFYALERLVRFGPPARTLVFTHFDDDQKLCPTIKAGARGYLLKETDPKGLLAAIREVAHGGSALHLTIARRVLCEMSQLPEQTSGAEPLAEREVKC